MESIISIGGENGLLLIRQGNVLVFIFFENDLNAEIWA